jgi:hypothetical protein
MSIVLTRKPLPLRRNMFARLLDAIMASRQIRANREIERYLAARHQFSISSDCSPERNMEARMHFRHIVAIAALLIFSFGVTVFFLSRPIADAAVWHTHQVRSDANLNVSPIGEPPYP